MAEHYVIIALQHSRAVKTPLFQYLVGGPKEELGAHSKSIAAQLLA